MNKKYIGSDFDEFLHEEGILAVVEASAWKRVIAFQTESEMKRKRMTKTAMATQMKTSRAALERLLD
ncbi:MAG: Fis family transcriptional regulator, partial [Desulfobulbaceae bacterium A2]